MSYTVCKFTPLPGETEAGVRGCPPRSMAETPGHGAGQWAKGARAAQSRPTGPHGLGEEPFRYLRICGLHHIPVAALAICCTWARHLRKVLKVYTYYKEHVHILSTSAWHTHGTHMAHYMAHSWHTTWHTVFYCNSLKINKRASEGSFQGFNTYTIKRSVPCSVP